MDEYEMLSFLEEDARTSKFYASKKRKIDRATDDPFSMDDEEFRLNFRLSKNLARQLCEELRPVLREGAKSSDLSLEAKVLIALSFFGFGSYQRLVGIRKQTQPTVSIVLNEVVKALNLPHMLQKYIHFPATDVERNIIKAEFYKKFKIPGVLGCIDGTHVAIVGPVKHGVRYFGRKHYHSLNVQLVCDSNMTITSVDASYCGSTHDSYVWENNPLKGYMEQLNYTESAWFLGDSGYPLRKWMMTPIIDATPRTPEAHYTDLHVRARNIVERTIGLLKARFRCLLSHRVLHYEPDVAGRIVNACVVLHNICNNARLPMVTLNNDEMLREARLQAVLAANVAVRRPAVSGGNTALQMGFNKRQDLVGLLWSSRRRLH